MTSSSADWTLAGARLISSASRKLANTGPSSTSKPPPPGLSTRVPTTSEGTRSGVNWMRLNVPPSTWASVLIVSVLASPGTPSSRTWPPASSATSSRSSIASWPTMTRLISYSASSRALRACSGFSFIRLLSGQAPEPAQRERAGDGQQRDGAADEPRGDLAGRLARAELRAQAVVDGRKLVGVLGRVRPSARGGGDLAERLGVGRHLARLGARGAARARHADRAVGGAQRDGVDRDAVAPGALRDDARVLARRRLAV